MTNSYDVTIIGAGPVGCVAALAFARRGAQVLLLEANPRACRRLAGEWLHPPAVEILADLGVGDVAEVSYPHGRGFTVFPDDGSERIALPYRDGSRGVSLVHDRLVHGLRAHCSDHPDVRYLEPARATEIDGHRVVYHHRGGAESSVTSDLVVCAAGRSSVGHRALGDDFKASTYSRMAGLLLRDATLPEEGYGHLFLGGPGPVLGYRVDERFVRLCLDVPLSMPLGRNREAVIWEAFRPVLPAELHESFAAALRRGDIAWAANQTRPRVNFGREGLVLIGDAVGHHHPLTALGMTLGFQDAVALAGAKSFDAFRQARVRDSRVPEMLAVALYEVFADTHDEVVAIRSAVYDLWRRDPGERRRTMGYLACQATSPARFGRSFVKAVRIAAGQLLRQAGRSGQWRHTASITRELAYRTGWLIAGAMRFREARPYPVSTENRYGPALEAAAAKAEVVEHPASARQAEERASAQERPLVALERATRHLETLQRDDGSWEGECVWCPLLPAQYVLMCHITGTPLSAERRRLILRQFERTQLPGGQWGLHELSEPYLFVTALVYVAARLLDLEPDDPLLARARWFIHDQGGVVEVPSWGKFWLALVGLYDWEGVNPVLPEAWQLPRWLPLHPSNYYCHTRLIYLGMAVLYGREIPARDPVRIAHLRHELYPVGYHRVDWGRARHRLRAAETVTPPSTALRAAYNALRQLDRRLGSDRRRQAIREELIEHMRFELRSTAYTCISPVNGLLNLIALWLQDPHDPDFRQGLEALEGWMWADEADGLRIAGARSATWDTSFAAQALSAAAPHVDVSAPLERADAFLESQQIRAKPVSDDYGRFFRVDPTGGYCFAGVWHGWPVSDCTAEAMLARLQAPEPRAEERDMAAAVDFVLRTQCPQGGFGSYEPFRPRIGLEWLNPAEMFGDSMTEHAYVECTASCIAALAAFRERYTSTGRRAEIDVAVDRGSRHIRRLQRPDGSWSGNWGVHFIYGTMFGLRGLLAAGAPPQDPAIRKACRWLKRQQRPDGGWGESHEACLTDAFVPARSQVIQTAWALSALLEAQDPEWNAIDRAAHFLASRQGDDGSWPKEAPVGVFFHTALLRYERYRDYFPVWALGQYETRRLARLELLCETPRRSAVGVAD